MKDFNVIIHDFNSKDFEPYNIMPYFIDEYNKVENKPKTFDEFRKFVDQCSMYQFWSRCEYEIILCGWPDTNIQKKWDIYEQIKMNIDLITEILMENVL